jgi:hypothetical protein
VSSALFSFSGWTCVKKKKETSPSITALWPLSLHLQVLAGSSICKVTGAVENKMMNR